MRGKTGGIPERKCWECHLFYNLQIYLIDRLNQNHLFNLTVVNMQNLET